MKRKRKTTERSTGRAGGRHNVSPSGNDEKKTARKPRDRQPPVDWFAKKVSDDLSEPLSSLAYHVEMLEEAIEQNDREAVEISLDRIETSSVEARQLVFELLRYLNSGKHEVLFREVALDPIMEDVVEALGQQIEERGARIAFETSGVTLLADPALLYQILQNLLSNAIASGTKRRKPEVAVRAERMPGGVLMSVTDKGAGGLTNANRRMLQPFPRLNVVELSDASNVGLAIVAQAVRAMGWSIDVKSKPDRGSTFRVFARDQSMEASKATGTSV